MLGLTSLAIGVLRAEYPIMAEAMGTELFDNSGSSTYNDTRRTAIR